MWKKYKYRQNELAIKMNFHNFCERNINGGKINWQLRYRGEVGLGKALFKYKWAAAGLFLPNVLLHQVLLHQSIATSKHQSIHSRCFPSQCIPSQCIATSSIATPNYCYTKYFSIKHCYTNAFLPTSPKVLLHNCRVLEYLE